MRARAREREVVVATLFRSFSLKPCVFRRKQVQVGDDTIFFFLKKKFSSWREEAYILRVLAGRPTIYVHVRVRVKDREVDHRSDREKTLYKKTSTC